MAYAMTKRGSLDNEITYEFICDTIADMNSIEPNYRTIGTVAIVLSGESEGLEVYIAGSDKQWSSLSAIGDSSSSSMTGGGLTIYICSQEEVDQGLPDIDEPDESVIYLVANSEDTNNLYDEYIYVNDAWEKFGSAGIDLSGYAPIANPNFTGSISLGRKANSTIGNNSVALGVDSVASGQYSVATGAYVYASGICSHVEGTGNGTTETSYSIYNKSTTPADRDISSSASYVPGANGNYTHVEGIASLAISVAGHAEGYYTLATGSTATHTEGYQTYAGGGGGEHAEGKYTYAQGSGGEHAEGEYTYAAGSGGAHAEGYKTMAVQKGSHSEGEETLASGQASHAEGTKSQASGNSAHAEGYVTNAAGNYSHAEGYGGPYSDNGVTKTHGATGTYAHSEGMCCDATAQSSHAEGYYNKASGLASHVEGYYSVASGDESHAEGYQTTASGTGSHAEGNGTSKTINGVSTKTGAIGSYSHSEGYNTTAYGNRSHAEGEGDTITYNGTTYLSGSRGQSSHSEGNTTLALGNGTHAEGFKTIAEMDYSHAEGNQTQVKKSGYNRAGHAEGISTVVEGNAAHAEGYYRKALADYSHAEGQGSSTGTVTIDGTNYNTNAIGISDHVEGYQTCSSASGKGKHAEGYLTVAYSGDGAHAEGIKTIASSVGTHAEGQSTSASGSSAHAEGYDTLAQGYYSHAEGNNTRAQGDNSHTEGYYTRATGDKSNAIGSYTLSNYTAQHSFGSGNYSIDFDSYKKSQEVVTVTNEAPEWIANTKYAYASIVQHTENDVTTYYIAHMDVPDVYHPDAPIVVNYNDFSNKWHPYSPSANEDTSQVTEWDNSGYTSGTVVKITEADGTVRYYQCHNDVPTYVPLTDTTFWHTQSLNSTFNKYNMSYYYKWLETVGNAKNEYHGRSNARALDWDGNEYLNGDLYVGCNADSTGGIKLARIPDPPTTDGTYTLQATVSSGTITYTWIAGA